MAESHQDGHHGVHAGHHAGPDSVTDVVQHQRTFEGFIHFWIYVFGAAAAVLIFLAIFNT
jgi:hypothetical protein